MQPSDDIANLFQRLGVSPSSYREMSHLLGTVQELPCLSSAPAPALGDGLNEATQPAANRSVQAQVVVLVSGQGGVGKSTLTAALATFLNSGSRTYAIDLDPQNAVMRNLALDARKPGLAQFAHGAASWQEIVHNNHCRGFCLPYGTATKEQQQAFERTLNDDPEWLARHVAQLHTTPHDTVVIDTPAGYSVYLDQALKIADLVLMVTLPDAAGYHALERMGQALAPRAPLRYVINQLDTTRDFSQRLAGTLRERLGGNLLGVIHLDQHLGESLASGRSPMSSASNTTGCLDLLNLARALQPALAQSRLSQLSTS